MDTQSNFIIKGPSFKGKKPIPGSEADIRRKETELKWKSDCTKHLEEI